MNELENSLEDFANKVGIIMALEKGKKKTVDEAYNEIKLFYKAMKKVKKSLDKPKDVLLNEELTQENLPE